MAKILAFAGSSRTDSFNRKLIAIAAQGAQEAGAEVTLIDLRDYPMPIFDQDYEAEQGMPDHARQFKRHLMRSDGVLISSPEYNSGYSGLLKNCIDWASRSEAPDEKPLVAFGGKCVALMSASPSGLGGIRGLVSLRMLLGNLGMTVLPGQVAVSNAMNAFNEAGQLADEKQQRAIMNLGINLTATLNKLNG
ncbi:NADPH-dependent FMN reductase [Candidatus Spongiihabitans sp.]|uniref:NADPH-dependent FMN reductase n=1 Tax=Candidatus Spongiihabitans sp. TaxID=3101308 RepID=UPI003C79D1C8